jgi:N-acetylglucosaminyldiphosphoundecaprenol N-acetyl-beta-D-mannosaminyltransferase
MSSSRVPADPPAMTHGPTRGGDMEPFGRARSSSRFILGMRVDGTNYEAATDQIVHWAAKGQSRYVCVAAVNNVMHSYDDPTFREAMNGADLVTPDGMPLVWGLRRLGVNDATRVYGPDLTPMVLAAAEREAIPVGFLGSAPRVLTMLLAEVDRRWPALRVAYAWSPPFTALTDGEDADVVSAINASGARILFVGLGCPKQEHWMAGHRGTVEAAMVGVGAAFDFLAGEKRQAPTAMRGAGLEWLFRLITEPRRLAKRYLRQNPRFAVLFGAQLIRSRARGQFQHGSRARAIQGTEDST